MRFRLLLLLAGCLAALDGVAAEYSYFFNGERIPLVPSTTSRALKIEVGQIEKFNEDFQKYAGGRKVIRREELPILEREYQTVLLRRHEEPTGPSLTDAFAPLADSPAVRAEVPVFSAGEVEFLLVNEFIIQFEDYVGQSAAEKFIQRNLPGVAKIIDDEKGYGLYAVRFAADVEVEDALGQINDVRVFPEVRYAQPDFVRFYPPRRPRREIAAPIEDTPAIGGLRPDAMAGVACHVSSHPSTVAGDPNDELFGNQWALRNTGDNPVNDAVTGGATPDADIDGVEAWESSAKSSAEITVAVVDLGVQMDHPDLAANMGVGYDVETASDIANPTNPYDNHGTAVAGIVAAVVDNGIGLAGAAAEARIAPIKIGHRMCETCGWPAIPGVHRNAIRKAVELGARVLVNSWGIGDVPDNGVYDAILYAIANGTVVVFSAGNHERTVELDENGIFKLVSEENEVEYPARWADTAPHTVVQEALIAVSATNQKDEFKTHNIEDQTTPSTDPEVTWGSNRGPAISLSAPGVFIYTTDNTDYDDLDGYTCFGGTSAAAPFVAGAAALLLAVHPTAANFQVKDWLQRGADPGYGQTDIPDEFYGHGRLNAAQALDIAKLDISLEVEDASQRIGRSEQRWVSATVTREGQPAVNIAVAFTTPNSGVLEVTSSPVFFTNNAGIATAQVTGRSLLFRNTEVRAQADGETDTVAVKVPSVSVWALAFMAAAAVLYLARCNGNHIPTLLAMAASACLATADIVGLMPMQDLLQPLALATAGVVAVLLHWCNFAVVQSGNLIYQPGTFSYEISHLCTAFWPAVFLSALILTDSNVRLRKLPALVLGIVMLLALNLLRLVNLFWIGVSAPDRFTVMHDVLWPAIMFLALGAVWISTRRQPSPG